MLEDMLEDNPKIPKHGENCTFPRVFPMLEENPQAWCFPRVFSMLEDAEIPKHGVFPVFSPCLRIFRVCWGKSPSMIPPYGAA
jgi:hypothetical protein